MGFPWLPTNLPTSTCTWKSRKQILGTSSCLERHQSCRAWCDVYGVESGASPSIPVIVLSLWPLPDKHSSPTKNLRALTHFSTLTLVLIPLRQKIAYRANFGLLWMMFVLAFALWQLQLELNIECVPPKFAFWRRFWGYPVYYTGIGVKSRTGPSGELGGQSAFWWVFSLFWALCVRETLCSCRLSSCSPEFFQDGDAMWYSPKLVRHALSGVSSVRSVCVIREFFCSWMP